MKFQFLSILFICVLISFLISSCDLDSKQQASTLQLSRLFSDHMVIQRNKDIHIFGKATPHLEIKIDFAGKQISNNVNASGKFNIKLPPLKAGGPYEMNISTKDTSITISDILIGDVWVCSGQSNMEFELKDSKNGKKVFQKKRSNQIRMIDIPKDKAFFVQDEFRNKLEWQRADIDSFHNFSAVAYYYGVELEDKLNIPIGLIASNWGGTNVETWTQTQALDSISAYQDKIDFIQTNTFSVNEIEQLGKEKFATWKDSLYSKGIGIDEKWYLPDHDISSWQKIKVPGYWENQIPAMKDFDGVVWYRTTFDITPDFKGENLKIWLSQIHDYDMTWLNGVKIGENYSPNNWRGYTAEEKIVKEKNNVLVVRIYNRRYKGGFAGIPAYFDYYPENGKEFALTLAGDWSFKAAKAMKDNKELPMSSAAIHPNDYPSLLYNAMINPMIQFPIKGAIWYQGETNAPQAYLYRKAFPALINNWRQQWKIGDFPFYFVQLADFGSDKNNKLGDSFWAELREAQNMTLTLTNTGMATALDIGNPIDVHPINKTDVGKRLAYNALHNTYGIETLFSGPSFSKFKIVNFMVTIEYENLGSGLITNDGKAPREFIIAGADKVFYKANAKIHNNTIVISSPNVRKPVSIRYAWKNSPDVNLYNNEGLPAAPFRTDDWKGTTFGNAY